MNFSSREAFGCYEYYLAVKRHFTTSYDFFKFNGKIKCSPSSFEKRNDRYQFYKLSNKAHPKDRILANIIVDPNTWIGDIVSDDHGTYNDWKRRNVNLANTFCDDMSQFEDLNDAVLSKGKDLPKILQGYCAGRISLESICILDAITNVDRKVWAKYGHDTIIYPGISKRIHNYKPFMTINVDKIKSEFRKRFY